MCILRRKPILVLAFSCLKCVSSYDYSSGSFVTGDLSSNAPWSLSADAFTHDTKYPDSSASFNFTGYNVSADTPSPQSTSGWEITAAVKDDVSLSSSMNSSVDKNSVFEATTLYIQAPAGMTLDTSWRMCAVVYPGVSSVVANSTTVDGTCNGVFNNGCLQALSIAGTSSDSGMDGDGSCTSFILPKICKGLILEPPGNMTAFAINKTVFDEQRFYAFGSMPADTGNITAHDEARQNVWPVIMIYGHLSSTGQLTSKNAGLQCVRAVNGTTDNDLSGAARLGNGISAASALGAGLVLFWILIK